MADTEDIRGILEKFIQKLGIDIVKVGICRNNEIHIVQEKAKFPEGVDVETEIESIHVRDIPAFLEDKKSYAIHIHIGGHTF